MTLKEADEILKSAAKVRRKLLITFVLSEGERLELPRGCLIVTIANYVHVFADCFDLKINPAIIKSIAMDNAPPQTNENALPTN